VSSGKVEVEFMTEALWVTTRQESRSSRTTVRAADVSVSKSNSTSSKRVNVWCRNVLTSVNADVCIAHIVRDDHNDVRRSALGADGSRQ